MTPSQPKSGEMSDSKADSKAFLSVGRSSSEDLPPALRAYEGPKAFTPEEVARGNVGIRWVTETYVAGRPSSHDLMEYLLDRGEEAMCSCPKCKEFFPLARAAIALATKETTCTSTKKPGKTS